jgi:Zinc carboxypeptidase
MHQDKMWRKTRRPITAECIGVDGNRNYDAHWFLGDREKQPCMEVYRGDKPFSEPETRVIRDILLRVKTLCFLYISIHTYGNSIIYPYGYTTDEHPNKKLLHQIAQAGVDAVKAKYNTVFTVGQSGSR